MSMWSLKTSILEMKDFNRSLTAFSSPDSM